jgi:hypothetical protein
MEIPGDEYEMLQNNWSAGKYSVKSSNLLFNLLQDGYNMPSETANLLAKSHDMIAHFYLNNKKAILVTSAGIAGLTGAGILYAGSKIAPATINDIEKYDKELKQVHNIDKKKHRK